MSSINNCHLLQHWCDWWLLQNEDTYSLSLFWESMFSPKASLKWVFFFKIHSSLLLMNNEKCQLIYWIWASPSLCRMIVIIVNCNILNSSDNNIFKQQTFICESTVNIYVQKSYMEFILSVISETEFFCKEAFRFKS